jgi:hypothetical protein
VLRDRIPLLETIAPLLIARSESRMRHDDRKTTASHRTGSAAAAA